jgi:hypothetical protein
MKLAQHDHRLSRSRANHVTVIVRPISRHVVMREMQANQHVVTMSCHEPIRLPNRASVSRPGSYTASPLACSDPPSHHSHNRSHVQHCAAQNLCKPLKTLSWFFITEAHTQQAVTSVQTRLYTSTLGRGHLSCVCLRLCPKQTRSTRLITPWKPWKTCSWTCLRRLRLRGGMLDSAEVAPGAIPAAKLALAKLCRTCDTPLQLCIKRKRRVSTARVSGGRD